MKTSRKWNFKSIAGKIMLGLVLAVMIGSIDVAPALAKNDHKSMEKHDNRPLRAQWHVAYATTCLPALWLLWPQGTSLLSAAAGCLCTASTAGHRYLFPAHFYSSLMGLLHVGCPVFNLS